MAILAVAAATVVLSATPPAPAAGAALPPRTVCPGQRATAARPAVQLRALRCLVNWTRRHAGLTRLRPSPQLTRSAAIRASDIRRCNDFSHTPCGQSFLTVFTLVGYLTGIGSVGENLAWGQGRLGSPRVTLASWLRSPDHRQILLTPEWHDLGVATVKAPVLFGRTNVTLWVAQFGRRPGALPLP
jgi:uncharacterized protein YkwD